MGVARRLVEGKRDDAAIRANAAAAGLRIRIQPEPDTEVWPENGLALGVAMRMMSQLNVGMSGLIGYRYEALPIVLDALQVPADERLDTLDALRVIEAEFVKQVRGL